MLPLNDSVDASQPRGRGFAFFNLINEFINRAYLVHIEFVASNGLQRVHKQHLGVVDSNLRCVDGWVLCVEVTIEPQQHLRGG